MIKKNGGIFGRNPTYNDVVVEGVLTLKEAQVFDNDITINGDLIVNGTETVINTVELNVDDKNITMGAVVAKIGLAATTNITAGQFTVQIADTAGLIPGMTVTKTAGTGAFGVSPKIASIDSHTQITLTVAHATSGTIIFDTGGATDDTADGGGITLKGTTDKFIKWVKANLAWVFSDPIKAPDVTVDNLTASKPVFTDANKKLTSTGTLAIDQGGTGATTAADARTALGLGTMATQAANNVAITGGSASGLTSVDDDNLKLDGNTLSSTNANGDINLTPNGNGKVGLFGANSGWLPAYRVIDLPGGAIEALSGVNTYVNSYRDPSGNFIYKANGTASRFAIGGDTAYFYTAASGTAGGVVPSWATSLFFGPAGLGIGNTADPFSRGYAKAIVVKSSGQSAFAIESGTGSYTSFDMGINGSRLAAMSTSANETQLTTLGATPLYLGTNSATRILIHPDGGVALSNAGSSPGAGNLSLPTGNLIIGTSGKGIDFSATPGTGTSELFSDYEEGTWTPVVTSTTGAITSYTVVDATYTKIGRQVTVCASVTITNAGTGAGTLVLSGLPYTNGSQNAHGTGRENALTGYQLQSRINASDTAINIVNYSNATCIGTNAQVRTTITYFV